jgi:hypothetical protein
MLFENQVWLTAEEVVFHRMHEFHRQRVEAIANGKTFFKTPNNGMLIVHLIPEDTVKSRIRFQASVLREHGSSIWPLGEPGGSSRFNVDGFMTFPGHGDLRAYSQLFRHGRLESVMSDVFFEHNDAKILRDANCEQALFDVVSQYLRFCTGVELKPPVWLFTALVGCENVHFLVDRTWGDLTPPIDRATVYLPEIAISSFDIEPKSFFRPLCDTMWQAGGMERSLNYDKDGKRVDRRGY